MLRIFNYTYKDSLRVTLNKDGKMLFCLLDVSKILELKDLSTTQIINKLNPVEQRKLKINTGGTAFFITYPELMALPDRIGINKYALNQLSEFIKNEVAPSLNTSIKWEQEKAYRYPKNYAEALRELADTSEELNKVKANLEELKSVSIRLMDLVDETLIKYSLIQ